MTELKRFDKKQAELHFNKLLKEHKIKVIGWSATSSGRAWKNKREIKVPKPTNIDRYAVCLHEIFHVISRKGSKSFEKEFYCDMYARSVLIEQGYCVIAWDKRIRWHVLSRIAMAHNRGLNHSNIKTEIRDFLSDIDFSLWIGKKVFVGHKFYKSSNPDDIEFTKDMSLDQVKNKLFETGYTIRKSMIDDSTYGTWVVTDGDGCSGSFIRISEIIKHYKL